MAQETQKVRSNFTSTVANHYQKQCHEAHATSFGHEIAGCYFYIVHSFCKGRLLKCKQPAHDKGTPDSADTLLNKALIQGHTVNSDILG